MYGGISLVDLRVLGLGRRLPVKPLLALAVPWAVGGFFLAAFTGILMFTAHAGEFLTQPVFLVKMGLILAAGSNAAMLHAGPLTTQTLEAGALPPPRVRLAAGLSLALWIGVIFCGRLLAYL
jgi:hypothetical protein